MSHSILVHNGVSQNIGSREIHSGALPLLLDLALQKQKPPTAKYK